MQSLNQKIAEVLKDWQNNKARRLWASDTTLWTHRDEAQWMGWLNVIPSTLDEVPRIEALAEDIKAAGFKHIVLLGMGGSSLCAVLMAQTFGQIKEYPCLHILDSTDPMQIRHLEDLIDLKLTFFIVSSKSGTTLEPNILKSYFYTRLQAVLKKSEVGDRFLAITDPNTPLDWMAKNEHFKTIFYGLPSIGGRYSALSNFGMVPLGLMGIDVKLFLNNTKKTQNNRGVELGVYLGVCAQQGKDKVTVIVSPGICALGAWLEQLIAESTGKMGKGLIPIDQEPLGDPNVYNYDRVFVYIRLDNAPDIEQDRALARIEESGQTVIRRQLANKLHLGAELFSWEIATAVACSILGINPFNQPDVEASKVRTLELMTEYEKTRKMITPTPFFAEEGLQLFSDETNVRAIRKRMDMDPSLLAYLEAHFSRTQLGDYVCLSAFIENSEAHTAVLQEIRRLIRDGKKVATCLGFGPRLLHSSGQLYKGGPNTGVFLQITSDKAFDIWVPNHAYTFGFVINAQAQADFEALVKDERRILRIHLGKDSYAGLQKLKALLSHIFQF